MSKEVLKIPLNLILADEEFNCRGHIKPIDVADLANDIKTKGLIQPVIVAPYDVLPKKYKLIAGFRRFKAHELILADTIDAIVNETMVDDRAARFFNLSENLQRENLSILQEAKALKYLKEQGLHRDVIAKELGKSPSWVQIRFYLLELPKEIQEEVNAGIIPQTNIRELWYYNDNFGRDKCLEAARRLKEAKERGLKNISLDPKKTNKDAKRPRKKNDILIMLDHLFTYFDAGLWSKCFAWAMGEISDRQLYAAAKEEAKKLGINYEEPDASEDIIPDLNKEIEAAEKYEEM